MKKLLVATVALWAMTGCSRRSEPAEPTPTTAAPPVTQVTDTAAERRARDAAELENRRRENARLAGVLEQRVHFAFDSSDLDDAARRLLDAKAPILGDRTVRIRIEGHADERGSVEYNLALSLRRANAVRAYLLDAGVSAGQMEVASFGEEQPLETGSNENAWSANRRAEFRILNGLAER